MAVADTFYESDLTNLSRLLGMMGVLPPGMYLDNTIRVAQQELLFETDYAREAQGQLVQFLPLLPQFTTTHTHTQHSE